MLVRARYVDSDVALFTLPRKTLRSNEWHPLSGNDKNVDNTTYNTSSRPPNPPNDPLRVTNVKRPPNPLNSSDTTKKCSVWNNTSKSSILDEMTLSAGIRLQHTWTREQEHALDWAMQKAAVLKEYTTAGKVSVDSELLGDANKSADSGASGEAAPIELEKARQRLQAMETQAARREAYKQGRHGAVEISQSEYIERIRKLHKDLRDSWERGAKVISLRLTIFSSKLLSDARVPAFYPSMFVLITSLLDTFGQLVFDRIKQRADEEYRKMGNGPRLPENFAPWDIGSAAREMCRNWLFKISCIRELLPRIYVEMALLPCYRFLSDADYAAITLRLAHSCRGIGDPLVATYARWYLCRNVHKLVRHEPERERTCVRAALEDYLVTFASSLSSTRMSRLEARGVSTQMYLWLQRPAVKWQFHELARTGAGKDVFQHLMRMYKQHCCFVRSGYASNAQSSPEDASKTSEQGGALMILEAIVDAFPGKFYNTHVQTLVAMVEAAAQASVRVGAVWSTVGDPYGRLESYVHPALVYRAITKGLITAPPPIEERGKYLNAAWRVVARLDHSPKSLELYLSCAEIFLLFVLQNMPTKHALMLLNDIARHILVAQRAFEEQEPSKDTFIGKNYQEETFFTDDALESLQSILTSVAFHSSQHYNEQSSLKSGTDTTNVSDLVTTDAFAKLFDSIPPKRKVRVSETLLAAFVSNPARVSDPVLLQTFLEVARAVASSIDGMSGVDERRRTEQLLTAFLRKPEFGRDLERQITFLVEARAAFIVANSDAVIITLVNEAIRICHTALSWVKGSHSQDTLTFVKTVLAFAHITIPSISDILERIKYFIMAGETAVANGCIGQADGLYKAAMQEIPTIAMALESMQKIQLQKSMSLRRDSMTSSTSLDSSTHGSREETNNELESLDVTTKHVVTHFMLQQMTCTHVEDELCHIIEIAIPRLLAMPGHPEHGPLYLVRGLLNACRKIPWSRGQMGFAKIQLSILSLLFAFAQTSLPSTHVSIAKGTQWNGNLFASDQEYAKEISTMIVQCIDTFKQTLESMLACAKHNETSSTIMQEVGKAHAQLALSFMMLICNNILASDANAIASHNAQKQQKSAHTRQSSVMLDDEDVRLMSIAALNTADHVETNHTPLNMLQWGIEQCIANKTSLKLFIPFDAYDMVDGQRALKRLQSWLEPISKSNDKVAQRQKQEQARLKALLSETTYAHAQAIDAAYQSKIRWTQWLEQLLANKNHT